MNIKINFDNICIVIFTFFFFFWGINIYNVDFLNTSSPNSQYYKFLINFKLSYFVIFLTIPIFFNSFKKRDFSCNQMFNYQQYILFFALFILIHFFFIKIYHNEPIDNSEIENLFYFISLSVIYCHYRNFILVNFKKILTIYLIIFVSYSIIDGLQAVPQKLVGQCNNDLYLIDLMQKYLKIHLTKSIYLENSHLAMMAVAVFFASIFIIIQGAKNSILFVLLFSIEVLIVLNNLSTTYFVGYFFSHIALFLFWVKKINIKFWVITFLFLGINAYLFLSDKHCVNKITQFSFTDVKENIMDRGAHRGVQNPNLTTGIYQRSIIVAKETLINHSLGWGIDGMDNANNKLLSGYSHPFKTLDDYDPLNPINDYAFYQLRFLNLKDGLSNFLKLVTEFGVFSIFIFLFFIKYLLNIKNISGYNVFVITLFITLCIRSAGFFNGGFIFCLFEFFYLEKYRKEIKLQEKVN